MVHTTQPGAALTLYTAADDIQCHRVRLVLAFKGITYQRELVDQTDPPDDMSELTPYGDVPVLVQRDTALYDTRVVCEYLDERYPHPPLMPTDPLSRARLRLAAARIERDWLPLTRQIRNGRRGVGVARRHLQEQLLTSVPLFRVAPFFLNPELSLVDCVVAPVIWRLPALGVSLGKAGRPLLEYGERMFHTPGFGQSLTSEEEALRA